MDWVALDAVQTAGGVLIMWDRRVLEKVEVLVGSFSVQWKGVEDSFTWACSGRSEERRVGKECVP